jgi:hypothetical protein
VESRQLSHKFLSPDQNKKNIQAVEWKTGQQQKKRQRRCFRGGVKYLHNTKTVKLRKKYETHSESKVFELRYAKSNKS